jgi:hypothetical protein
MIRELGEAYGDFESRMSPERGEAWKSRIRRPWPLLKLPEEYSCEQDIGIQDEGSEICLNYYNPSFQQACKKLEIDLPEAFECREAGRDSHKPVATASNSSSASDLLSSDSSAHDPKGEQDANSQALWQDEYSPETISENNLPPKLEEFIPDELFPDILLVYDPDGCALGDQGQNDENRDRNEKTSTSLSSTNTKPVRYKRVFPASSSGKPLLSLEDKDRLWIYHSRAH